MVEGAEVGVEAGCGEGFFAEGGEARGEAEEVVGESEGGG